MTFCSLLIVANLKEQFSIVVNYSKRSRDSAKGTIENKF